MKKSIDELRGAVKRLKCGKTPGCGKITAEIITKMEPKGHEDLLKICNRIWKEGLPESIDCANL